MLDLPAHLSKPVTDSTYVFTPLGTIFMRNEALYALKAARERNTFLSAA